MQNQRRYAAILLAALAAGMLTAGCGKKTPAAPVAEQDTEYSLVIEDTPVSAPEESTTANTTTPDKPSVYMAKAQ